MGKPKEKSKPKPLKDIPPHATEGEDGLFYLDPDKIRFQHSRVKSHFSGCGRSVPDTLDDIRSGRTALTDLPPIQVIIGDVNEEGGVWYYSLNNRRLWVIKQLKREGLVERVGTRARRFRGKEPRRYCIEKCVLEASLMGVRGGGKGGGGGDPGGKKEEDEEEKNKEEQDRSGDGVKGEDEEKGQIESISTSGGQGELEVGGEKVTAAHKLNAYSNDEDYDDEEDEEDEEDEKAPINGFAAFDIEDSSDEEEQETEEERQRKIEKAKRQAAKRRRQKEEKKRKKVEAAKAMEVAEGGVAGEIW